MCISACGLDYKLCTRQNNEMYMHFSYSMDVQELRNYEGGTAGYVHVCMRGHAEF